MFPIPWNFPLRKKNGNLVNIGDAIDEGTELPAHGEGDAGKVLSVDENGDLEWSDDVNSEIQTLTNKLNDEVETRAKLGAHNIFPLTIDDLKALNTVNGTWSGNSFTMYGITYNCEVTNGYVSKITVSGTATATSTLELFGKYGAFASNKYKGNILSGCPSGGSGTSYCIVEQTSASSAGTSPEFSRDEGSGAVIGDNDYARLYIRIEGGYVISGSLIFKPMIRLASDSSTEFTPYAMTNRELTDNVQFYNANTDGTVKQNHYAVAKGIGETLAIGGMVTKLVRFSSNYTDFMIISKNDSGYIYCIDFMSNSGFGKIMSFRYNPGTDVFTDEFIIT